MPWRNPLLYNAPLHHVGIVQPDEEAVAMQMEVLGLTELYRGYVPQFHALCIFTNPVNGGSPVEFVVADGGSLVKFNRGAGGIHHIAFEVPDIEALTAEFAEKGIKMIEPAPVKGAGNFLCNFLSPVATRGIIVEYVQLLPE
jgi:catechol 2,3-dioxygenase-like lactoylglutathione lyase family enzyme